MKKLIAFILAAVLLFCCTFGTSAAEEKTVPIVVVRGLDFNGLILDQGTKNERPALSINVPKLIFGIVKTLTLSIFGGTEGFVDGVIDVAGDILSPLACDKNGNTVQNVSVKEYDKNMASYPEKIESSQNQDSEAGVVAEACERYGAENVYYVTYDWRLDPYKTADKINARVNLALKESGCNKVKLICCSMGGVMTQAYFDKYGYEKIESCMFLSTAIYGAYSASDPLSGKVSFDKSTLNNFLNGALSDLSWLWSALDSSGVTDGLIAFANNLADNYKDKIYDELLMDTFACMPGIWAMHITEDFDSAKQFIFGGKEEQYAGLIKKIDKYQEYCLKRDSFLKQMQADGVEIMLVCSYNKPVVPVYEHSYCNGDQVLETELMSAGATVAPYGKTLGDDYVAANPEKLSPDRVIDASTCLFPDNTWFIKNATHVCCRHGSELAEMIFWLMDYEGQPTVSTNILYPQFQICDDAQNLFNF